MITNRRQFLTGAAVAAALPRSTILGANDRIRIGAIGTGSRCKYLLQLLQNIPGNQVVAVCDVYQPHREEARLDSPVMQRNIRTIANSSKTKRWTRS